MNNLQYKQYLAHIKRQKIKRMARELYILEEEIKQIQSQVIQHG